MDKKIIGACIRTHRKKKGLTQVELAEIVKVSENLISDYERGKAVPCRDTLFNLSIALDFSIDALVKGINYVQAPIFPDEISELLDKLTVSQRKIVLSTVKTLAEQMLQEND